MNRIIIIILLLLLPTLAFSKKVINSGHQSPVKFIEYLQSEDSFFSLSDDGTLVIKRSNSDKISKRLYLSSNSITQLAISSKNNQLAIVETDNASNFIISVWDWKLEKKLYSINLNEYPMSIGFSGGGRYLYVISVSSKPVKIFRARTGSATSYLNKNRNYIDYLYIGSSEKNAYLYSSSGLLDIRSLVDSKLLRSISTEKNLNNLHITSDKRYLIGQKNNMLYVIGRNDGKIYSEIKIPNLVLFELNQTTGEILCYINNGYKKTIKILQIVAGNIFKSNIQEIVIKNPIEKLSASYNSIIFADSSGNLNKYNTWNKTTSTFLTNDIINIEDITLIDDLAALLTSDKIFLFKSPFFSDKIKNSKRLMSFTIKQFESPLLNPVGSINYNGNLLLWNNSLVLFDIESGETIFNHAFTSEIIDIKIRGTQLLALDKNGIVKIIDLNTGNITFSFKSPGFTSVGFYNENQIIAGIDKSQGGSLMILDLKTKETHPLQTSLDVIFNIIESGKSNIIYIAGLKNINGKNQTRFLEFNLLTKRERSLLRNNSEELNSSFEIDGSNYIYTNMGTKSILRIDKRTKRIKTFQLTTNKTRNIVYNNGGLYTINENRSLSIWHPMTGKKLIDFYLFKDNEWVAISQDRITAFGSPNSERYISSN